MSPSSGQRVVVLGHDPSGEAAAERLRRRGAAVRFMDATAAGGGGEDPELVVVSAGCREAPPLARQWAERGIPVIGERELAYRQSLCLHLAVTGIAGKRTTARLIAHLLRSAGRRVEVASLDDRPASALVDQTRELDWLIHVVEPHELEWLDYFRPVVVVLLNVPGDGEPPAENPDRRWSRIFARQQAFDWAVIQTDALVKLRKAGFTLPGKSVTFGVTLPGDLFADRGMLISRWPDWVGNLWNMDRGRLRGPHFAEDALAAVAVGRVLRLSLGDMTHALESFVPERGRMELLGEAGGVRFIDDGCSRTPVSLIGALRALAPTAPERPFIHLIAGGDRAGEEIFEAGPWIRPRVRQVYVYGPAAAALRMAWSLFAPCSTADSLLDAAHKAVSQASEGETILFSPGCPQRESLVQPPPDAEIFRRVADGRIRGESQGKGGTDSAERTPEKEAARTSAGRHDAVERPEERQANADPWPPRPD